MLTDLTVCCYKITLRSSGVDHDELVKLVGKSFSSLPDLLPRQITKAEYVGGVSAATPLAC